MRTRISIYARYSERLGYFDKFDGTPVALPSLSNTAYLVSGILNRIEHRNKELHANRTCLYRIPSKRTDLDRRRVAEAAFSKFLA